MENDTKDLAGKVLEVLRNLRDNEPAAWEKVIRSSEGVNLCRLWDHLKQVQRESNHER